MFFTNLFNLMEAGQILQLSIIRTADKLTVSVMPMGENINMAEKGISPVTMTGSAQALDEAFITNISNPVKKMHSLVVNSKQFEESANKSNSKNTAVKDTKKEINNLLKEAEDLEKVKKYAQAKEKYSRILEMDKTHTKARQKENEMKGHLLQKDIFAADQNNTHIEVVEDVKSPPSEVKPSSLSENKSETSNSNDPEDFFSNLMNLPTQQPTQDSSDIETIKQGDERQAPLSFDPNSEQYKMFLAFQEMMKKNNDQQTK